MSQPHDVEVQLETDLGHSPRNVRCRDWLVDLANGNIDQACNELADDVSWEVAGDDPVTGIEDVRSRIACLRESKVTTLEIRHLISHGKEIAAEGTMTIDGNEERFVHIISYRSHAKTAKISRLLTYRA